MKVTMSGFSEYRRSGKVWHSPPFYYREGYKMCLAVYANGMGEGAGIVMSLWEYFFSEESTMINLSGQKRVIACIYEQVLITFVMVPGAS